MRIYLVLKLRYKLPFNEMYKGQTNSKLEVLCLVPQFVNLR